MERRRFRDLPDAYVSGNLFIYYQEGDPDKCRAPDVFVVFGVPKKQRKTYRLWEEGRAPTVAIELTSKSTQDVDENVKPPIYAELGIEWTARRGADVAGMDLAQLEALWADLVSRKRWP